MSLLTPENSLWCLGSQVAPFLPFLLNRLLCLSGAQLLLAVPKLFSHKLGSVGP